MKRKQAAILLIEDNPGDARLIREMLPQGKGAVHSLEWVENLTAGQQRIARGGIDLVLLDLGLPESTGLETFRCLRAGAGQSPIVVVLSGLEDEGIAAQAVEEGAQDYLIKGQVDGGLLNRSIRYALERNEAERALRLAHDELEDQVAQRTAALADTIESLQREIAERKRAEEAQRRLNRELRAISECNQTLLRAEDEQTILNDICRIICDEAGYRLAWVGYAEHDDAKTVRPVAWGGFDGEYVANAKLSWGDDTDRGRGPGGTAIRSSEIVYIQDFTTDPRMAPWRESALQRGYRSVIGLPLKDENANVFGVLLIYSTEINSFTPDEIRLLEELAGDLAFGIGVLRTRADRKRAEEALRKTILLLEQSSRFTDALLSAIPTPVFYKDREGRYLGCNRAFTEIMGVTSEQLKGRTVYELWPGEYAQVYHDKDLELMSNPDRQVYEFEVRDKYGNIRPVIYIKDVFRDADNQVAGIVGAFLDITDRKRAEEEVRILNRELEQRVADRTSQLESSIKELEAFSYSVSHDLRAPLRHIDGFLELLQQRTSAVLDEQSRHYMTMILDEAKRMGVLIDELLSFSRMGRQGLSRSQVDLNKLVQEIVIELESETKGRTINWHITGLPIVSADRTLIRAVLANVISNAIKFTRPCAVGEIEIGSQPGAEAGQVIYVRDNGVGFDMQYAGKLFGVFQRLHSQEEFEGTGIGLATVHRIITRHGGRVWAEGELGHGATFYFALPQFIKEG